MNQNTDIPDPSESAEVIRFRSSEQFKRRVLEAAAKREQSASDFIRQSVLRRVEEIEAASADLQPTP